MDSEASKYKCDIIWIQISFFFLVLLFVSATFINSDLSSFYLWIKNTWSFLDMNFIFLPYFWSFVALSFSLSWHFVFIKCIVYLSALSHLGVFFVFF